MSKPRILMVTSVFPRWAGDNTPPFVYNLAEDMAALGYQITVLAPHHSGAKFEEIIGNIKVVRFRYMFPTSLEKLCYNGGMLINLRKSKWLKLLLPLFFIAQMWAIRSLVTKNKFDLIHSHSLLPQGYACTWIAKKKGLPHITTSHGNDVFGLRPNGIYGKLKQKTLKAVEAIIVNSSATRDAVTALGADSSKIYYIPSAANITPIQEEAVQYIKSKYPTKTDAPLIVFVGRLIEEKGVGDLIGAVSLIKKDYPSTHCMILGDGQDRAVFEKQVSTLNLQKNISFLGWIEKELITSYIAAADIFVGPSKPNQTGWTEAQGLTFVEAMSANTPIIATEIGGIPDMIKHLETGILIKPNDPGAIATHIKMLMNDLELAKRLAKNAKVSYEKTFSRTVTSKQHMNLYEKILVAN